VTSSSYQASPCRAEVLQQTIREQLLNRKDQLLKAAYYDVARNETKVANYFSKSIVDQANKGVK
jgi:peptidyl-prolyl cis-trans isomerase SurA